MLTRQNRQKLIEQLMRHEGRSVGTDGRHYAYRCPAGILTIGYGHNLEANSVPGINPARGLSEGQAQRLLVVDLMQVQKELFKEWPALDLISQERQAVLLNMAFNLGVQGLLKFKRMFAAIDSDNYKAARREMESSRWFRQVGDGPGGHFDRAEELALQMETSEWQF